MVLLVLALANADDEVVAIVAAASGHHFRSSILLASETADADTAAADRTAVMIQVFGAVQLVPMVRNMLVLCTVAWLHG